MMFSILIPTRGRPTMAEDTLLSILNTQSIENEVLFYLQEDDERLNDYISMLRIHKHTDFYIGPTLPTPIMWNLLAERASNDYFMLLADDVIVHTKDWDIKMDKKLSKIEDKIFVAGTNEYNPMASIIHNYPFNNIEMTCHPIVHRRMFELLGYFIPLAFQHSIVDVWMTYLARCLDRFVMFKSIYFEHLMKTVGSPNDSTRGIVDSAGFRDFYVWNRVKRWWRSDVDLLNKFMAVPLSNEKIDEWVGGLSCRWWNGKKERWDIKKYEKI